MKKTITRPLTRAVIAAVSAVVLGVILTSCGGGGYGGGGSYGSSMGLAPAAFSLTAPANTSTGVVSTSTITLTWGASLYATSYTVEVSTVNTFATTVVSVPGLIATSYAIPANTLASGTQYFWRVIAFNASGMFTATAFSFTTM